MQSSVGYSDVKAAAVLRNALKEKPVGGDIPAG
jgi:hypothetical protein